MKELPTNASISKTVVDCKYCRKKDFNMKHQDFAVVAMVRLSWIRMKCPPNYWISIWVLLKNLNTFVLISETIITYVCFYITWGELWQCASIHGIYTLKVQGQMYHFINDLVSSHDQPRNLHLYFYDDNT